MLPFRYPLPENTEYYGILAEFSDVPHLFLACENVRDEGFTRWDAHTPFPVHGLSGAMGLRRSTLPWIVLGLAVSGAIGAMALQGWASTVAYPLVISGKPFFSWQAYVPITFELAVLGGALAAVFGMLALNRLPMLYHPLFHSKRFEQMSDDKFFISIEAWDPKFEPKANAELLRRLGATHVELVGH